MSRKRPLILVADDDEPIRRLMRVALMSAGFDVETAGDGIEALEAIERLHPDLVVLDMVMPRLNGWGVLRRLVGPDAPPVIAVSGEYQPASALRTAIPCVRGYALKPLQMRTLVRTCAQILATKPDSPTLSLTNRRCEPRHAVDTTVTLLGGDRSALAVGRTRDLSRGGLCMHLGIALVPEQPVRLHFDLPGAPPPLSLRGVARWSQDGKVGVAFSDLDPAARAQIETFLDSPRPSEPAALPKTDADES